MRVFLYFICFRQSNVTLCQLYIEANPSYNINLSLQIHYPLARYKIVHSFVDSPSHTVPQALAIASELAISLRRWSNIDNWHAECENVETNCSVVPITFPGMRLSQILSRARHMGRVCGYKYKINYRLYRQPITGDHL